jgi:hypothetical protein
MSDYRAIPSVQWQESAPQSGYYIVMMKQCQYPNLKDTEIKTYKPNTASFHTHINKTGKKSNISTPKSISNSKIRDFNDGKVDAISDNKIKRMLITVINTI